LIEAVVVTLLGGIIGMVGGVIFSYAISVIANLMGYDWAFIISPLSIILAITVSAAVGLVFGLYPARKASRLEPVEALRYE
ncbi:FtsX-like permease family protein, partial [Candidatus Parcubacteria bacterium]|nr:FtsX-like permease family protein [Candidatus Parcubacteria bacterium]